MPKITKFVRDQYTTLPVPQPPADMASATYIVTGANSGLGLECAKHLVRMGARRVIMAVRSRSKGETALSAIRSATGRPHAGEVWELDLASPDSVEAFARRVDALDRLDGLIANAGVAMSTFELVGGMETTVMVNVISTMLLAFRTLPKLSEWARRGGKLTNLVIVSSNTALEPELEQKVASLRGDVFDALSVKEGFAPFDQYPMTKLLEIFAVRQLASIIPVSTSGVVVNTVNPGLCYSDLDRNLGTMARLGMAVTRRVLARTSEQGSRTLLHAAFAGPESYGAYCSECQVKESDIPAWITSAVGKSMQKRVWTDLLKRLESIGHGVDIEALAAK
ncbi:related to enoyl-CoA hydratase/isomerase [Cephalotrichum gorgonifer]|uniref:Related to enoyl-CoA hydratase/isomerase n=1 Tax=Cephalotrichum gorgonifer TaxID=2041049 RepID=A0AAE8MUP0_9PEZI|nr:related to enoyl-CoA hydratase/isomerase [Cephalotrichum gorgonifer]